MSVNARLRRVDDTALGMASVVITLRQTPRVIARHSGIFEGLAMLQLRFHSARDSLLERQTDSLVEAQKNQTGNTFGLKWSETTLYCSFGFLAF